MIRKISTPHSGPGATVVIEVVSPSGKVTTAALPLKESAFRKALADWKAGELIQDAFPTLDADQRELLKTGIGKAEWDDMFSEEGEDSGPLDAERQ